MHFHCIQRLTASAVDAVRYRGIPYLVTLHDGWWVSPNQFVIGSAGQQELYEYGLGPLPARAQILARGLRDAGAVLAVSPAFAALHQKAGLPRVEPVENGIQNIPEIVRQAHPEGRIRLGHIGGAERHKGYTLLRAAVEAGKLRNIDLTVVDHALPLGQTRQEVWTGTPVTFVPRLPLDRVAELYGALDVLIAPSIWPESFGLVAREALAAGLWVVASDLGAIGQDVVEGENGHIVPVDDARALANCLARIDSRPGLYRTSPRVKPKLRSSQDQARDLAKIYDRVLARGAGL